MEKDWISRNLIRQTSKGIKSYPQNVQLAARTFGKISDAMRLSSFRPDRNLSFVNRDMRILVGLPPQCIEKLTRPATGHYIHALSPDHICLSLVSLSII